MNNNLIKIILLCILITFTLSSKNQWLFSSEPNEVAAEEFFDVSQLKRGMKGYGLTVFEGVKPEKFLVEIIGVLKTAGPKTDLILARFSGGPLKQTGVIAGMSGSPVYIDGKLVGAVSHAYPWAKEPIGAIRPIKEMIAMLKKRQFKPKLPNPIQFIPLETSLRAELETEFPQYLQQYRQQIKTVKLDQNKNFSLYPIKTPVLFGGIESSILDIIRPEMETYGMYPVTNLRGGRVTPPDPLAKELNPGDAVGIMLMGGDLHASPVGTVTYRKGNEILIFGHPAFSRGHIDMPMTKEYIHTVIPNRQLSFKLASTISEVGRVVEDRYSAVVGELGTFSQSIPVRVKIKNEGEVEELRFKVVRDPMFFPNLLTAGFIQAVSDLQSKVSYTSINFKFRIKVKNLTDHRIDLIETHDYFTGGETQKNMFQGLFRLLVPIQAFLYNPYVKTEIVSIEAEFEVLRDWNIVNLIDVRVLKKKVKPGEKIPLLITFQKYQGKRFYKKMFITLPANVNAKKVNISIGSAKAESATDKIYSKWKYIPQNYDQLLNIVNKNQRFNDLAIWIDIPEKGLLINGEEHPNLPASMISVMKNGVTLQSGVISGRIKKYYRSNYLVNGLLMSSVSVDQQALN